MAQQINLIYISSAPEHRAVDILESHGMNVWMAENGGQLDRILREIEHIEQSGPTAVLAGTLPDLDLVNKVFPILVNLGLRTIPFSSIRSINELTRDFFAIANADLLLDLGLGNDPHSELIEHPEQFVAVLQEKLYGHGPIEGRHGS